MTDITFHGGRLPNDPAKPRLRLTLATDVAPPPPKVDWLSAVGRWPVYLNDRIGDCTCAAAAHMEQAWTAYASTEVDLPDSAVLAMYELASGYNPKTGANDNGAVMQDVCGLWRKQGIGGHKIVGFAQVDHQDHNQVRAAIAAFGAVYVGVRFPGSAMKQFNARQPWTVVKGATIEGGHAIHVGAYDDTGFECITWGARQRMDLGWWDTYVDEAWVVVTEEWLKENGQTPAGEAVANLGADFTALKGQPSPFPAPSPNPSPAPGPVPDVAARLAEVLTTYVTTGHVKGLRAAAKAWLADRP